MLGARLASSRALFSHDLSRMTPEEFRAAGHKVIDWIADYRARVYVGDLPVMATTAPGDVRRALPSTPPDTGA